MKRCLRFMLLFLCFLVLSLPLYAGTVSIITTDAQLNEKIIQVDEKQLIKDFSLLYNSVESSVSSKLAPVTFTGVFNLAAVRVGIGMSGEVGIGPIWVGAAVIQSLIFNPKN